MNYQDYARTLDLRDIVAELKDLIEEWTDPETGEVDYASHEDELQDFVTLAEDLGNGRLWNEDIHGYLDSRAEDEPVMVLESDFQDYAQQLANELGLINNDAQWPHCYIDWEEAAEDLRQDYISVSWRGRSYLVRCV